MQKIPGLAGRVRVGAPDASLTPASGVVAVAELVGRLGMSAALDDAIGEIKQRDRGLSAGQFLVAVAQAQMCGAQFWVDLDRRRADTVGEALSVVATPASTTAVELAERFGPAQVAGIEEGIGEIVGRVMGLLPAARRAVLRAGGATIDLDGTDVECYGATKDGIAYSYKGARAGRPPVATWLRVLTDLSVAHVRCYADHVGGGRFLPRPVPATVTEDQEALQALLAVEAERTSAVSRNSGDLVVMDRSVHTLLAHRYALPRVTGLACFDPARRVLAGSEVPLWPDLVLYLDLPQAAVHDRNRGKFPEDSIFIDTQFNAGIRAYFSHIADQDNAGMVWLDATLAASKLVDIAEAQIRELLRGRET